MASCGRQVVACQGSLIRSDPVVIPRPIVPAVAPSQPGTALKAERVHRRCYKSPTVVHAVPSASQQDAGVVQSNASGHLSQAEQKPLTSHQLAAVQSINSTQGLQGVVDALAAYNRNRTQDRTCDLSHPELSSAVEARLKELDLQSAPPSAFASLLDHAADAGVMLSDTCKAAVVSTAATAVQGLATGSASEARTLTQLLWGLSELGCDPQESWLQAAAGKVSACAQEASLLACDLSTCLAALGAMGYKPDPTWASAMVEEVSYQLAEFQSDLEAGDVARLISGLADLRLGAQLSAEGNRLLMKAVYGKTRTIEDKAAVDFALAKLNAEERSMHYDPRWTHEELRWLPRRERDKRRIMSEGWYRTQWGGWAPGRRA